MSKLPEGWQRDFMSTSAAAKELHVMPRTLLGIIAKHKLTVIRLGWRVLVPMSTLEQLKRDHTGPYEAKKPRRKTDDDVRSQNLSFDF